MNDARNFAFPWGENENRKMFDRIISVVTISSSKASSTGRFIDKSVRQQIILSTQWHFIDSSSYRNAPAFASSTHLAKFRRKLHRKRQNRADFPARADTRRRPVALLEIVYTLFQLIVKPMPQARDNEIGILKRSSAERAHTLKRHISKPGGRASSRLQLSL